MLEHLHKWPVSRQEDRRLRRISLSEVIIVNELQSNQRLAGTRYTRDQCKMTLALRTRTARNVAQYSQCLGNAGTLCAPDAWQRLVLEKQTRRRDQ